jgi:hypothetical protein
VPPLASIFGTLTPSRVRPPPSDSSLGAGWEWIEEGVGGEWID